MTTSRCFAPAILVFLGACAATALAACQTIDPTGEAGAAVTTITIGGNVLTQHNDTARTGLNAEEKLLTPSLVGSGHFGKLYARDVDGQVYAQPLYVSDLDGKNVVFVATEHNGIFAFDADSASAAPLWNRNLGPSVPAADTQCGDLAPEVGITSTPVIDLEHRTIFLVAKTKENGHYAQRLHALDIATGAERAGSPVEITASAPGTGAGSVNGRITFDPLIELNRPGLLLSNGVVYLAFASHCDVGAYHGWVLGYDAATLAPRGVHLTTPNGEKGGIWHGGVGLAGGAHDLYYVSGNGTYDGSKNFGEAVVRLVPSNTGDLTPATSFAPGDTVALDRDDVDIGSTGALLIPGSNALVTGDKGGTFYVVARDAMGGQVSDDHQILQRFQGTAHAAFGGFAFFEQTLYAWGVGDVLKAYHWNGNGFDATPATNANARAGARGAQISVSANGASDAIVWTIRPGAGGFADGVLEAFDAAAIGHRLWASENNGRDHLGALAKFAAPTIAGGKVFIGTSSNQLVAYGGVENVIDGGAPADATPPDASSPAPTFTDIYRDWIGPSTAGHCSNCHTSTLGGFKCGASKDDCFAGLVAAGLIDPNAPATSLLGADGASPLAWFGGDMPKDAPNPNPAAKAALRAWILAGAHND
jgi:hypothetical protein